MMQEGIMGGIIFGLFALIVIILTGRFLPVRFWGDEYTTRHASRIRRILCGSHFRSFVTLVALPFDLGVIFGTWLDPLMNEILLLKSVSLLGGILGIIVFGVGLVVVDYLLYYYFILHEYSYKNTFYKEALASIIENYEKTNKVNQDVLSDYVESMFHAVQKHNVVVEEILQSLLLDREDELGVLARTILQDLQAKYSTALRNRQIQV